MIQEMVRVMLVNKDIPQKFWAEVVNTSCHIGNRIFFRARTKKMRYGRKRSPRRNTSGFLEVNASFSMIRKILGSLMPRAMKEFS